MESLKIIMLSLETTEFLITELEGMLKHMHIPAKEFEEIADLLHGLETADEIRLQLPA
jgi:hypothetical protein